MAALLAPASAALAADSQLFSACQQAPNSPICADKGTKDNPAIHVIKVAADIVALLTGIAAVILIIISGFTLVSSAGNQESVTKARRRIFAAIVGLVIVALAWTITRFVTDKLVQ